MICVNGFIGQDSQDFFQDLQDTNLVHPEKILSIL